MSDGQQSMSEILSPEPKPAQEAQEAEAEVAESAATGEEQSATPAQPQDETADHDDVDEGLAVPRKALISERKKRQETERQLAEIKGQLAAFERMQQSQRQQQQQQPQTPADEQKDSGFFNEPDPGKFIDKRIREQFAALHSEARLDDSVLRMAETKPDYFQMEAVFAQHARRDPALALAMKRSGDPARYAYDWAKNFTALDGATSYDELEKKIISKYEASQKSKQAVASASRATTSNAGARSVGGSGGSSQGGGLDDILKGATVYR